MYINSEAEKGPAAVPLGWVRGHSNEHPSAPVDHVDLEIWSFKGPVLPFLTSLEDRTLRVLGVSLAGCSVEVVGGTSKLHCDQI